MVRRQSTRKTQDVKVNDETNLSTQCYTTVRHYSDAGERTVQIKCLGPRRTEGAKTVNRERPRVNWQPPPFGRPRALWDGYKAKSKQTVWRNEGAADWRLPPWTCRWHAGLTKKLKAPEEPGATPPTLDSMANGARSIGRFLLEHLGEGEMVGGGGVNILQSMQMKTPSLNKTTRLHSFLMPNTTSDFRDVWSRVDTVSVFPLRESEQRGRERKNGNSASSP